MSFVSSLAQSSRERHHVMEMLEEREFPVNTLFCADGGYVGYDLWRAIDDKDHHFLMRVGGNVRLLKSLGHVRERNGIVYCWPNKAMRKKQSPLVLRLLQFDTTPLWSRCVRTVVAPCSAYLQIASILSRSAAKW
ncbi:transposase [Pirellulales bacterium]|nr:transposase [Pirellulales bacterium]